MRTAKQMLLTQLTSAFSGRRDMPIMAALAGVTDAEASWAPASTAPSIDQIVRHVAWSKNRFCQQAFGVDMVLDDPWVNDDGGADGVPWEFPCGCSWGVELRPGVRGATGLLGEAQAVMVRCLEELPEDRLGEPLAVRHGDSAFTFFWTMIMHDLFHAGQIRTRRTAFGGRGSLDR